MTATTQHLSVAGLDELAMLSGYLVAFVAVVGLAMVLHVGVRKDRRIDGLRRQVRDRDRAIEGLAAERDFLDRQNRALYERLDHIPVSPRCVTRPRRRQGATP